MNFDQIVVKESPGLCRCCLSEGCYKDLGTEYTWMNETEVYAEMLLDCFDVGITQHNDGPNGPKRLICEVCITRLRDACNFKKQVVDSEKRFIDMLGRGEFRPKVVMYQPSEPDQLNQLKVENEELEDATDDQDVEYLEDVDFSRDDEQMKSEDVQSTSQPTTSEETETRKRGRPRKYETTQPKKPKLTKDKSDIFDHLSAQQKKLTKDQLVKLYTVIIENSTMLPFRWHSGKFMCFYCGCLFHESNLLKQHNENEHDDTKIRSAFRTNLRNFKIKFDASVIKCKQCSIKFVNLDDLLMHFKDVHTLKFNLKLKSDVATFKLSDDKMQCHECGEGFSFFGTLLKHSNKFHSSKPYICHICGKGFTTKAYVTSHLKHVHEDTCEVCVDKPCSHKRKQSSKCPKCSEVFPSQHARNCHLARAHDFKGYQFACDLCPQVFLLRYRLIRHKQRVHMKVRSIVCEICGYKAFNRDSLKRHMVSHSDDRPFECEFCKKAFQRKKTLEFHRRIHTNDKRFVCKDCGKAFVQTTSLKIHYRVHHPKDSSKDKTWR